MACMVCYLWCLHGWEVGQLAHELPRLEVVRHQHTHHILSRQDTQKTNEQKTYNSAHFPLTCSCVSVAVPCCRRSRAWRGGAAWRTRGTGTRSARSSGAAGPCPPPGPHPAADTHTQRHRDTQAKTLGPGEHISRCYRSEVQATPHPHYGQSAAIDPGPSPSPFSPAVRGWPPHPRR